MATTTDLGRVRERSTGTVTAVLKDEADVVIPAATLTTLTLTLYDVTSGDILNSRDGQNVLNMNNVTVDSNGNLTWLVQSADHAIVKAGRRAAEKHRAVFEFTWSSGTKRDWHAVEFSVEPETAVTA